MTEHTTTETMPAPLDLDALTLGEVATIERLGNTTLAKLGDDDRPQGKLLAALVYVQSRRHALATGDASVRKTWDECLAMRATDAGDYLGLDDEDDATAEDEAAEDQAEAIGDGWDDEDEAGGADFRP